MCCDADITSIIVWDNGYRIKNVMYRPTLNVTPNKTICTTTTSSKVVVDDGRHLEFHELSYFGNR